MRRGEEKYFYVFIFHFIFIFFEPRSENYSRAKCVYLKLFFDVGVHLGNMIDGRCKYFDFS